MSLTTEMLEPMAASCRAGRWQVVRASLSHGTDPCKADTSRIYPTNLNPKLEAGSYSRKSSKLDRAPPMIN